MMRKVCAGATALAWTVLAGLAADDARTAASKVAAAPTAADNVPVKAKENSFAAGLTLTEGNSKTLVSSLSALHERKRDDYTLRLGADFAYGKDHSKTTTENGKAYAEYRRATCRRGYLFGNASIGYDSVADVNYRAVVAAGPGYYLMKDDRCTLGLEAGPAFIQEKVAGEENSDVALRVGERYDRQLSATAKCWQALEYLPVIDDFNDYLLNGEIGVEAAINASASIRLVVKDAYDSTPASDRKENDLTVLGALAFQI